MPSAPAAATTVPTRERILDAAEQLFAEASYDAVSLCMITRRAGVELATTLGPAAEPLGVLYELLLGPRASRADGPRLGLRAVGGRRVVIELAELEEHAALTSSAAAEFLVQHTGRRRGAIERRAPVCVETRGDAR